MEKEALGTVVSVSTQWWLKINTKSVRMGPMDGATFPHIIKVQYKVGDTTYTKRKWIGASSRPPIEGEFIRVRYQEDKPSKAKVLYGHSPPIGI